MKNEVGVGAQELVGDLLNCITRLLSVYRNCPLCERRMPGHHAQDCEYMTLRDRVAALTQRAEKAEQQLADTDFEVSRLLGQLTATQEQLAEARAQGPEDFPPTWERIGALHKRIGQLEELLKVHVKKIRNQKTEIKRLQELHAKASAEIDRLNLAEPRAGRDLEGTK